MSVAAPTNLRTTYVNASRIDIAFNNGDLTGVKGHYYYITPDGGSTTKTQGYSPSNTTYSFTNLTNHTVYTVGVSAYTDTEESTVITMDQAAQGPLTGLYITHKGLEDIEIAWDTPNIWHGNTIYARIKLSSDSWGGTSTVTQSYSTSTTTASFNSLTEGTAYDIQVYYTDTNGNTYDPASLSSVYTYGPITNFRMTSTTTTSIALAWDTPPPEISDLYIMKRLSGGSWDASISLSTTATSYTFTGLSSETYDMAIWYSDNYLITSSKAYVNNTPTTPLEPTNFALSNRTQTDLVVSWTNAGNNVTGHNLNWTPTSGGTTHWAYPDASAVSYTISSLEANTTYTINLWATNSSGASSPTSLSETTLKNAPAAPSNLYISNRYTTSLQMFFTDNANNEDGLRVWRKTSSGGAYVLLTTLSAHSGTGVVSYTNSGLTPNHYYGYIISAYNNGGQTWSNSTSTTTLQTTPAVPSNFQVTSYTQTKVSLSWTEDSTQSGFTLQRSIDNSTYSTVATLDATTKSYTDTGLNSSTEYWYQIKANNSNGSDSAYTTSISVTTLAPTNTPMDKSLEFKIFTTDNTKLSPLSFGIIQKHSIELNASYAVKTPSVTKQIPISYKLKVNTVAIRNMSFTTKVNNVITLPISYKVKSNHTKSNPLSFNIVQKKTQSIPLSFNVEQYNSTNLPLSFIIKYSASTNRNLTFNVKSDVTLQIPSSFTISENVSHNFPLSFDVKIGNYVHTPLSYNIKSNNTTQRNLSFMIANPINYTLLFKIQKSSYTQLPLSFNVMVNSISKQQPLSFGMLKNITIDKETNFTVESKSTSNVPLTFNVIESPSHNLPLSFNVTNTENTMNRSLTYNIEQITTIEKTLAFKTILKYQITLPISWAIANTTNRNLSFTITQNQPIDKKISFLINFQNAIQKSLTFAMGQQSFKAINKNIHFKVKGDYEFTKPLTTSTSKYVTTRQNDVKFKIVSNNQSSRNLSFIIISLPKLKPYLSFKVKNYNASNNKPLTFKIYGKALYMTIYEDEEVKIKINKI